MALEIFKLVGSIFVDNEEANKSISKTDEKAQGVGTTFANGVKTAAKWGAAIVSAAATATTAVVGLASTTVDSFADYEQLTGGVETLFKQSSGTVLEYAKNAYKTAGMTANQYLETVTSFSASLLQGLGGDTDKAASIADMAITDMSDNANKMGTDISSIQTAYQGFAKQNYTMLDNLKLGYGGTKDEMTRLLADATKLSGIEYDISNVSDIYNAIHVIQTEMDITGTTAKEGTTTISGSIATIKAQLENFKTTIGSSIAPVVQRFLNLTLDNLPTIEGLIGQVTPVISNLMATLLPPLLSLAETLFPLLVDLFNVLMPIFGDILEKVLPIIVELLQKLLPPFIEIVQKLLPPLLELLSPLLELLEPIMEFLAPILELVMSLVDPILDVINALKPLMQMLVSFAKDVLGALTPIMSKVAEILSGVFGDAFKSLEPIISNVMEIFGGLIDFITGVFSGDWEKAWKGITGVFKGIINIIPTALEGVINGAISLINGIIKGINAVSGLVGLPAIGEIAKVTIPKLEKGGILEKGQTGLLEGNGAEAVVPLEKNRKWTQAVANDMDTAVGGTASERVEAKLADILSALEELLGAGIYLDTGALVGGLAKPLDKKLGQIAAQKARA